MDDIRDILATETAKGIIATGVEGGYDSVSCSTAGDYPSLGVSSWEGLCGRGDSLLRKIPGGYFYTDRTYTDIRDSGELPALRALLASPAGQQAQLDTLAEDCKAYVDAVRLVPTMDDTRCVIYACMWCPTSTSVVQAFLRRRWAMYNLRSLKTLRDIFRASYYIAADVGDEYKQGYANRAEITYQYVAGIDLTTPYGIPAYGEAGNGR